MSATLPEIVSLHGQEEAISLTEFRRRPGDVVAQAQMGKTFTITKNGKAIAVLSPTEEARALYIGREIRRIA